MNIKPILFSGAMVRAILDGRKTQTRRVVKPQPVWVGEPSVPFKTHDADPNGIIARPCQPGDILWVRETAWAIPDSRMFVYAADGYPDQWSRGDAKKVPSIHMPKWACRLFLRVTDVRVELLQEITEEDAYAEGVVAIGNGCGKVEFGSVARYSTARVAFELLWDSINGKKHPWSSNPWVWVISFERTEKPEGWQ